MPAPDLRILGPGDEPALKAFLLPRLASSMILLSNLRAAGIVDRGQPFEGTYAAAFAGNALVGAAAHYWNGMIALQAPADAAALTRAAARGSGRAIAGFLGPAAQVEAARQVPEAAAAGVQLDETERLYQLDLDRLLLPAPLRDGIVRGRLARENDLDLLTTWQVGFSLEALAEPDTPTLWRLQRERMAERIAEGKAWLLEDAGARVACTLFNATLPEAVQIGGVWTPPALRGRGYARAVVAASLAAAHRAGVATAILFTGEANVPAQRAYEALGFRVVGDYRLLLLRAG